MYTKSFKIKEIKERLNEWKQIPCSWTENFSILNDYNHKLIYRFNIIPMKILAALCVCVCVCVCVCINDKPMLQFHSVTQLCPTICNQKDCSMPGLPVPHQLPEFTQILAH